MEIKYEIIDNKVLVKVSGELNVLNAGELEQTSLYAMKGNHYPLIIDLTELTYISSSGLGVLVYLGKEIKQIKRKMSLVLSNGAVSEIFRKTGLLSVFDITIKEN